MEDFGRPWILAGPGALRGRNPAPRTATTGAGTAIWRLSCQGTPVGAFHVVRGTFAVVTAKDTCSPWGGLNTDKPIQHTIIALMNAAQSFAIGELNLIGAERKNRERLDGMRRMQLGKPWAHRATFTQV
jgi:hypothetical protein